MSASQTNACRTSLAPPVSTRRLSLRELGEEIRRIEGGFGDRRQRRHVPTGIAVLDAQLPGGGLAAGAVHELVSPAEADALRTAAVWLARQASAAEGQVLWLDDAGDFYPPAAWALGSDPRRLILVRPRRAADAFWAMDQALRCPGMAAVVGSPGRLKLSETRRLQLAAETGGGVGLLLSRQEQATASVGTASRWRVRAAPPAPIAPAALAASARRFWVEVLHCRGGRPLPPLLIEAQDDARLVAVPAELADRPPAPAATDVFAA